MYFDEVRNKLFTTFNYQLTVMTMKAENRDRVLTHERPVTGALYNWTYNQVAARLLSRNSMLSTWLSTERRWCTGGECRSRRNDIILDAG